MKQPVGLMGGTVSVESEPRKGSTFTVELPFAVDTSAAPRAVDLEERVIAIIGEPDLAAGLEPILAAWACRPVAVAAPPAEAAAIIVDGRRDALAALAAAHNLAGGAQAVILVAEPGWSDTWRRSPRGASPRCCPRRSTSAPSPTRSARSPDRTARRHRHRRRRPPPPHPAAAGRTAPEAESARRRGQRRQPEDHQAHPRPRRARGGDGGDGEAALDALGQEVVRRGASSTSTCRR